MLRYLSPIANSAMVQARSTCPKFETRKSRTLVGRRNSCFRTVASVLSGRFELWFRVAIDSLVERVWRKKAGALKGVYQTIYSFQQFRITTTTGHNLSIHIISLISDYAAAGSYVRRKKGRVATREIDAVPAMIREATGWHLTRSMISK